MKKCITSIVDSVNPFGCNEAYVPDTYPSQDCLPTICLTHTERESGEPFVISDEEPVFLPDCITIAFGEGVGTELTLTGTEYEGTGAVASLDASDTWQILIGGTIYTKADSGDLPIGTFNSTTGEAIGTVDCEAYTATTETLDDCIELVYASTGTVAEQQFQLDGLGESYIGDLAGGVLTYVSGNWQWSVGGSTFIGPDTANNAKGLYTSGGEQALFTECVENTAVLPDTLTADFADDPTLTNQEWTNNSGTYVSEIAGVGDVTYEAGTGWTFIYDPDNDINTADITYVKSDDPLDADNPVGLYSSGAQEVLLNGN